MAILRHTSLVCMSISIGRTTVRKRRKPPHAVDVETMNQMAPRLPLTESVVFFSIMAVFLALRCRSISGSSARCTVEPCSIRLIMTAVSGNRFRTEDAIKTRDERIATEKVLRAAQTARYDLSRS
eukprot:594966-Rhodomonas_salina.1